MTQPDLVAGSGATERLRQRADFVAAASAAKASAAAFVLQARVRDDEGPARIGFTVSRKVGNSVVRNRVRRRLREVVRLTGGAKMRRGTDYVLIGRRNALSAAFDRLTTDLIGAIEQVHGRARTARRPKSSAPHSKNSDDQAVQ